MSAPFAGSDCSRRQFVRIASLALAAGAVPDRLLGGPPRLPLELEEIRRGVGTFSARGGTIGWLARGGAALVVDSQFPDTAARCRDGLAARAELPLEALINTHHHGDHTAGNAVLGAAARRIVAHARVPELQRRAADEGDEPIVADTTFEERWALDVGDERVVATHRGPAHTGGDCTVHFERADVVHMGDLVFNRFYPFIDLDGGASTRGWISTLEAVATEHGPETIFIFGHGREGFGVVGSREDVLVMRDLLARLLETAERAIAAGQSREEATRIETLPGFPDHRAAAEWISLPNVLGTVYDELADG